MFIAEVISKGKQGKSYSSILLRESFRVEPLVVLMRTDGVAFGRIGQVSNRAEHRRLPEDAHAFHAVIAADGEILRDVPNHRIHIRGMLRDDIPLIPQLALLAGVERNQRRARPAAVVWVANPRLIGDDEAGDVGVLDQDFRDVGLGADAVGFVPTCWGP